MPKDSKQRDGQSLRETLKEKTSENLSPAYGHGPFSRPLPRPTGCWAGCVRSPCCLTNRPDRKNNPLDWAWIPPQKVNKYSERSSTS